MSFADWFNRTLRENPDPLTGEVYKDKRLGELLGFSGEKVATWRRGTREPSTVADVRAVARLFHKPQSEILEAIGFEVQTAPLTEDEKELLQVYGRLPPIHKLVEKERLRQLEPILRRTGQMPG